MESEKMNQNLQKQDFLVEVTPFGDDLTRKIIDAERQTKQIISKITDKNKRILERINETKITEQIEAENLGVIQRQITTSISDAEKLRLELTKPYREIVNRINKTVKEMVLPLESGKQNLRQKLFAWQKFQEVKAREAEAKRQKEIEEKRKARESEAEKSETKNGVDFTSLETEAMKTPEPVAKSKPVVRVRRVWTFDIIDKMKIHRSLLQPDEKAINEAIKRGERKLSGIRVYQQEIPY